jgi:hypothetical protein
MADGRTLQYQSGSKWYDNQITNGPHFHSNPGWWRIKPEPREHEAVVHRSDCKWVQLPNDWPEGTKVRVTEILEDEALREGGSDGI